MQYETESSQKHKDSLQTPPPSHCHPVPLRSVPFFFSASPLPSVIPRPSTLYPEHSLTLPVHYFLFANNLDSFHGCRCLPPKGQLFRVPDSWSSSVFLPTTGLSDDQPTWPSSRLICRMLRLLVYTLAIYILSLYLYLRLIMEPEARDRG